MNLSFVYIGLDEYLRYPEPDGAARERRPWGSDDEEINVLYTCNY